MKKLVSILAIALCMCMGVAFGAACNGSADLTDLQNQIDALKQQQQNQKKAIEDIQDLLDIERPPEQPEIPAETSNILVVSREAGSGTRDAFQGLVKDTRAGSPTQNATLAKDKDGNNYTSSPYVISMSEQSVTNNVLTIIASNQNSIGYVGMASANDTVRTAKINGAAPSDATVLDGSYKLQRPFVVMMNKNVPALSGAADFAGFMQSSQAQDVVTAQKLVKQVNGVLGATTAKPAYTAPTSNPFTTGDNATVILRGSSSMESLLNALIAEYKKLNTWANDSMFDIEVLGSSAGQNAARDDTKGNVIGLSSSAWSHDNVNQFNIALEGVAVILHKNNPWIPADNLTINDLFDIYTGKALRFASLTHVV